MEPSVIILVLVAPACGFWDEGTTTEAGAATTAVPRQSFFRWPEPGYSERGIWNLVIQSITGKKQATGYFKRQLGCMAGISIDFLPLGTGVLMSERNIITAANLLEPYITRMRDLRVWTIGKAGKSGVTPYRYRVWRWRRLVPRSLNPEHQHGPGRRYSPLHDVVVLNTLDRMYIFPGYPDGAIVPFALSVTPKNIEFGDNTFLMAGSGFKHYTHVKQNFDITWQQLHTGLITDCEDWFPKYWGQFVCIRNVFRFPGVQNGMSLFYDKKLMGLGCFEYRVNEQRIMAFTDLRDYHDLLLMFLNITKGEYYEYAYSQWGNRLGFFSGGGNQPYIPAKYYHASGWFK